MNKRFGAIEFNSNLAVATILDPRYKNVYFKRATALAQGVAEIKKLMQQELSKSPTLSSGRFQIIMMYALASACYGLVKRTLCEVNSSKFHE